MAQEDQGDYEWRSLHASTCLLIALPSATKGLMIPLGLAISNQLSWFWAIVVGVPATILGILLIEVPIRYSQYKRYRYQVRSDEIVIRRGVFNRRERRIPFDRVQNMDLVQTPLQRMLGVGTLYFETAGGREAEATMRVLALEEVDSIRERVSDKGKAVEADEQSQSEASEDDGLLLRLSPAELVKLGLVRNQVLLFFGALAALAGQANLIDWGELLRANALGDWVFSSQLQATLESGAGVDALLRSAAGLLLAFAVMVGILILVYALSVAFTFLRYQGFRLRIDYEKDRGLQRTDEQGRLHAQFGLAMKVNLTTPPARIQRLRIRDGLRLRLLDRRMIRMETAGAENLAEPGAVSGVIISGVRNWLAPLIPTQDVPRLIRHAMPEASIEGQDWQKISPRALMRRLRSRLSLMLIVCAILALAVSPWLLILIAFAAPLLYFQVARYVSSRSYEAGKDVLQWRKGWWRRELTLLPYSRIQAVGLKQSPLDRRFGMATLLVDAAATGSAAVKIRYLDIFKANQLAERLNREAANRRFEWR